MPIDVHRHGPAFAGADVGRFHADPGVVVVGWDGESVAGVKGKIVMTTTDETTSAEFQDVYRVHLSRMADRAPFHSPTIVLESCCGVVPDAPLTVRFQRVPGDPGDTFIKPAGLAAVRVPPLKALPKPHAAQDVPGYNSWADASDHRLRCSRR